MKYYMTLFLCACLFPIACARAAIRINEVAWMGTATSQYSEWIELYNDGADAVSLAGWKIYKTGGTLLYTLSKSINAGGYLLVERITASAPDAVRGIDDETGAFGGGGLKNTGEDLILQDKDGNAINILPFASGWPAGDTKTKDTMQWTGSKWITAPGTPDAQNAAETVPADTSSNDATEETPQIQTAAVPPPFISTALPTDSDPLPVPTVQTPIITSPDIVVPTPQTVVVAVSTPIVPAPVISAQPPAPTVPAATKKTATITKKSTSNSANNISPDALEDPSIQPSSAEATAGTKENNHTKTVIFGAVIFIGMALFLLLQRFKARQE